MAIQLMEAGGAIEQRICKRWLHGMGAFMQCQRLGGIVACTMQAREVAQQVVVKRGKFQSARKYRHRIVMTLLFKQHQAKIVIGIGKLGFECNGMTEYRLSRLEIATQQMAHAQKIEVHRLAWRDVDGGADATDRMIKHSGTLIQAGQCMMCLIICRLRGNDLAITLFRRAGIARLLQGARLHHQLLDVHC